MKDFFFACQVCRAWYIPHFLCLKNHRHIAIVGCRICRNAFSVVVRQKKDGTVREEVHVLAERAFESALVMHTAGLGAELARRCGARSKRVARHERRDVSAIQVGKIL